MAQRTTSLSGNRTVIRTKTVYDANSRVVAQVDDRGAYTTCTYDALDRQLTMTFQDGSTRTTVYDLADDVTTYTDENGSVFNMTYDPLGRKTAVTITPATGVVGTTAQSFQYDGLSRMTFARDTVGSTNTDASFAFDSLNRLVEEVQTYGGNTQYVTHDQFNSTSATDLTYPSGRQVTNGYDALYRRNSISETSGGASIAAWQFTGGRLVECVLGNGLICTQLNNARTNSMVQSPNVPNPVWGNVSSDRLGYDGSGRMIAQRYLAGGINGTTFAYNNTTSLVGFTTYYDPNGNKLFERALHAEERSALYPSYDSLNRLLEYQRGVLASGGGSISTAIMLPGTDSQRTYDLDHLGNWKNTAYTPVGGSATTEVRRHNLVNQLTKFGSTPVLYDHGNNAASSNRVVAARGNGNIADDGTRVYAYDALNRLTTVTRTSDSAQVAAYTYDAAGRRVLKVVTNGGIAGTIANATYRYLYNDQQIVEELTGGNTTLRQFVWGQYIDELIQLKTYASTGTQPLPAGTYYPLQDLLYRTTALTDSSGNIVEAYDYDAYGNTLIYSGPGTDNTWFTDDDVTSLQPACEYLFTGRQYDPETQIYWYRRRCYDSAFGRFLNRDPALFNDGLNLYQYVRSRPNLLSDPLGLGFLSTTTRRCIYTGDADVVVTPSTDTYALRGTPLKTSYVQWTCKCKKVCTETWLAGRSMFARFCYRNSVQSTTKTWDEWDIRIATKRLPTDATTELVEEDKAFIVSAGGSKVSALENKLAQAVTSALTPETDEEVTALLAIKRRNFSASCTAECAGLKGQGQ